MENEWHTICYVICGIMYWVKLVEGKDRPNQMGLEEYLGKGSKTVGLANVENVPVNLAHWQGSDPW